MQRIWGRCYSKMSLCPTTLKIYSSCNIYLSCAPSVREVIGKSSFFFSFLDCLSFSSDYCPPQDEYQRICCLIGLYMNVNCICSNTVCSFTDYSCNITLYPGLRNNVNCRKERRIFLCLFVFSVFCAQLLTDEIFFFGLSSSDLVEFKRK